jgi:putative spermidine/putrescine transport system ATP-binding protein
MSPEIRSHSLSLKSISKRYGSLAAVDDISIDIKRGSFVTLLGPSGSGKSTVLGMIAGLVQPSAGKIYLDDRDITDFSPERRDFGLVFQGYALFPQMTVEENVWFPLRVRGIRRGAAREAINSILDLIQMKHLEQRLPGELSGGQQQRVALARALVFNPNLLLLDEPLSALDKRLRADLQWELSALHRRLGATFVNVTHDQEEAMSMSDDLVILRDGKVEQSGSPQQLYAKPESRFVAGFLGDANFIHGEVSGTEADHFRYTVKGRSFLQAGSPMPKDGEGRVLVALRPEKISIGTEPSSRPNSIEGRISDLKFYGASYYLQVATDVLGRVMVKAAADLADFAPQVDAQVWLGWSPDASVVVRAD